jgi:hypothetical protein
MGREIGPNLGALILCLPRTLLSWAVLTFIIAVIVHAFQSTTVAESGSVALLATEWTVLAVGSTMLIAGVLCPLVLWRM